MANRIYVCSILIILLIPSFLYSAEVGAARGERKGLDSSSSALTAGSQMSIDDSRMLVKGIPSVDIPKTLGKWKLQESELVKLREWSQMLTEDSGRIDFLAKWAALIQQVCSRNKDLKETDLSSLIQMVMSSAFDEAQKEMASGQQQSETKTELRKQFIERLRENLKQAGQLESLIKSSRTEQTDPVAGSGVRLPAVQRTLRQCEVQEQEESEIRCKDILVSTDFELDAYITSTKGQLKQAEEAFRHASTTDQRQGKQGKARLYALSDVARRMHDSTVSYLKK